MIKKNNSNLAPKGEYSKIDPDAPAKKIMTRAVRILTSGGILIYPTDTLYGFGVLVNDEKALARVYEIKKREKNKPFSIMVNDRDQAEMIVGRMTERERQLFDLLLPGKITLLVKARKKIKIPGLEKFDKIGFRIPRSKLCQQLVEQAGFPISSSSVNLSNQNNLINIKDIRREFQHKVDLILDGGPVKSIKGSSVLDISATQLSLLREGEMPKEVLEKKIGTKINSTVSRKFIITFICSGNICRSPMAEGILKHKLNSDMLEGKVEINSAGTLNLPTSVASLKAVEVSAEHGINIEDHLSRPVSRTIVDRANLIICLADNHYDYFTKNYSTYKKKIHLLKGYDISGNFTGFSIDDPIGRSEDFYREIYNEIEKEIDRIIPGLMKEIIKYVYTF